MPALVRHVSIHSDPKVAAVQNAENARDVNRALSSKLAGRLVTVQRYAARADTTQKIYLPDNGTRPQAVLLVRAFATYDAGTDVAIAARPNFYHDGSGLGVYEPAGLTLNTFYDLTFLILE